MEPHKCLIENILLNNIDSVELKYWGDINLNIGLHSIESQSMEYRYVCATVYGSGNFKGKVISIERIKNPFIMASYLLKKDELISQHGVDKVSVKQLFHGTHTNYIGNIIKNNFDWRLHGKSMGHKFGMGVCFSPNFNYAKNYSDLKSIRSILMAHVIIAKVCIGHDDMIVPPISYDTSEKVDGEVIVKYDDDTFYPAYKIMYTL